MTAKEYIGRLQLASPAGDGVLLKRGAYQKHVFLHPFSHIWQYNAGAGGTLINYTFEQSWGGGGHLQIVANGLLQWRLPPLQAGLYRVRLGYYAYNGGGNVVSSIITATGAEVFRTANLVTHYTAGAAFFTGADSNLTRSITEAEGMNAIFQVACVGATSFLNGIWIDRISA